MRRILLLLASLSVVVASPAPAFAQAGAVAQAISDLQAAHVDLSGPCGAVKITNLVAYRVHFGLLRKNPGYRAVLRADGTCIDGQQSNEDGYATDYIIDPATFYGFDLLGDSGGANNPQWSGPEVEFVDRNRSKYTQPIDPSTYMSGGTVVTPPVVVNPPPVVVTNPAFDPTPLLLRISTLEQQVSDLTTALNAVVTTVNDAAVNLTARMLVVESRPIPVSCSASVFGVPVHCALNK